ncbi:hypothetical protein ABZ832_24095 [Streptantibioticus parmotrematis]|nr:hypothetical protein [Streptantibioticus parmotrematis]
MNAGPKRQRERGMAGLLGAMVTARALAVGVILLVMLALLLVRLV